MNDLISWKNTKLKLSEIRPWEENPREITQTNAERLEDSQESFGQPIPLAVGPLDDEGLYPLYDGHQRYAVWSRAYGLDHEVEVRIASRPLSFSERKKLIAYLHSGATGRWDEDAVANLFDLSELMEWGMPNFTIDSSIFEPAEPIDDTTIYTMKVESPIYEPKMDEPPAPESLIDDSRFLELLSLIDDSDIPPALAREFKKAAGRFNVINFELMAELYSHTDPETRRVMEALALVIPDFERAIELGFVKLTHGIRSLSPRGGKDES